VKKRIITILLVGYFVLFALGAIGYGIYWHQYRKPPAQPIAFSHRVHMNQVGLECVFCHEFTDQGLNPSIPSVELCMSCHTDVKTNSPEIVKLTEYWKNEEPVPWIKVHQMNAREYVHFTHKRHIKAGIACETCHGDVKAMDQVRQVRSLTMGWCVSCHTENEAPIDCLTCHK